MVVLPQYPKAIVRDDLVVIVYEDGKTYVWGSEGTPEKAMHVAEMMDVEMKLLAYIQETADTFLSGIFDSVTSIADDKVIAALMDDVLCNWVRNRVERV